MITLFEDINENTKRVARERPSSTTPAVRETRMPWSLRLVSWLSARLHLNFGVNRKKELIEPKDDRVINMKIDPGQEEYPTFVMTEING